MAERSLELKRAEAARCRTSTANRSSQSSGHGPALDRILSGNHLDDQSHYRDEYSHQYDIDDAVAKSVVSGKDSDATTIDEDLEAQPIGSPPTDSNADSTDTEEVFENRDGIEDVRDRDMRTPAQLEKSRSRRSARSQSRAEDPNLVTWEGPSDPENPKNWTFKRKWGATIIGRCPTFAVNHMDMI